MHSPVTAQRVRRLKGLGLSARAIARSLGLARGTVSAILRGTWAGYRRRNGCQAALDDPAMGPAQRCPECGAITQQPCRACALRACPPAARPGLPPGDEGDLQLQLQTADHVRYQQVARDHNQAKVRAPAPETVIDGDQGRILTCCARCLWPLSVEIIAGRTVFFNRQTLRRVRKCPGCKTPLPELSRAELLARISQ